MSLLLLFLVVVVVVVNDVLVVFLPVLSCVSVADDAVLVAILLLLSFR